MILVLHHAQQAPGPDPVVEWLLASRADYLRLSSDDFLAPDYQWDMDVHRGDVVLDGRSLLHEVSVVWHRGFQEAPGLSAARGTLPLLTEPRGEANALTQYMFRLLRHKAWLPDHPAHSQIHNHLFMLHLAHQCGLRVPRSKVTNTRTVAEQFYLAHEGQVVSRPLEACGGPDGTDLRPASRFGPDQLAALPYSFFPFLLQENIQPRYELRIFYLDGICYTTAVRAQAQPTTSPAEADVLRRLHMAEYELPDALRKRLVAFMQLSGLTTGILDLIQAESGEYVFLDVSPIGPHLETTVRCHFDLEEKIARWLMARDAQHCHA